MGLMDWLCCYEFSIAFGSETDLQSYDRVSQSRKKKSRQMSAKQTVGRQSRIDSWTNSIQEDSLLEDMCQLADIEYDGDATHMTDRAKNKMLKRLSRAPQTENLFKSECRNLSNGNIWVSPDRKDSLVIRHTWDFTNWE